MKKLPLDTQTLDLFTESGRITREPRNVLLPTSFQIGEDVKDRLAWWLDPERDGMRNQEVWMKVVAHVRAALRISAVMPPARSDSEDSRHRRVGGAALGIYGENAVTSETKASL